MPKKYLLFFIFFLPSLSFAQLEELLQLGSMSSSIQKSMIEEPQDDTNDKEDDSAIQLIDPELFLGKDFGFSGEENFNPKQKEKGFFEPLEYFGYSFFLDPPSTFMLNQDLTVSGQYLIGPGDRFQVILYGSRNQVFSLEVKRDGSIFFPEVGPISVSNLTFEQARSVINKIVEDNILGAEIEIALKDIGSRSIFVLGEAINPGVYSVSSLSTLTNAIMSSGGIKKSGSLRNIQLKRNGEIIQVFDLYDLLLNGDNSNDAKLQSGDVIFIPPITKTVAVYGEVNRPSIYELGKGEGINDLIRFAGNPKPKANLSSTEIISIDRKDNSFEMKLIDLNDSSSSEHEIRDGDVLRIHAINQELRNAILLKGHSKTPGFFAIPPRGLKIRDIFEDTEDLLSMTQSEYLLIKRRNIEEDTYKFIQVNLNNVFKDPESSENIALLEKDELILFPRLITPSDINTVLIQDEYSLVQNQPKLIKDKTIKPSTSLRKSLLEDPLTRQEKTTMNISAGVPAVDPSGSPDIRRYYEYSVNNYCYLSDDFARKVVQATGYEVSRSVPIDQLKDINDPNQFQLLIREIEDEIKKQEERTASSQDYNISNELTSICRQQIMDPILDIIDQQNTIENSDETVFIFGNVYYPGEYPLTEGMKLEDIISASGGMREATYNTEIELTSRNVMGKKASFSNRLASSNNSTDMSLRLAPGDTITVKQIKKDAKTVEVSGEVFFTGTFPITEYQTLKELITRSGGLTEFAYINGAVFQRQSIKDSEIQRFSDAQKELRRKILLSSTGGGGFGEQSLDSQGIQQLTSLASSDKLTEKDALGRLVVDLDGILDGTVPDIVLEDGDKIHIPRVQQTITVLGEVFAPNAHFYSDELSLEDYLYKSGGINNFADEDNIYLIKSNGSIVSPTELNRSGFFRSNGNFLEAGDTIVVPLIVTPFSTVKATTEITQIIYQMALAAAAINSFSN